MIGVPGWEIEQGCFTGSSEGAWGEPEGIAREGPSSVTSDCISLAEEENRPSVSSI